MPKHSTGIVRQGCLGKERKNVPTMAVSVKDCPKQGEQLVNLSTSANDWTFGKLARSPQSSARYYNLHLAAASSGLLILLVLWVKLDTALLALYLIFLSFLWLLIA
jgi:hypothetical protein